MPDHDLPPDPFKGGTRLDCLFDGCSEPGGELVFCVRGVEPASMHVCGFHRAALQWIGALDREAIV
jgi:hypothetical protein